MEEGFLFRARYSRFSLILVTEGRSAGFDGHVDARGRMSVPERVTPVQREPGAEAVRFLMVEGVLGNNGFNGRSL